MAIIPVNIENLKPNKEYIVTVRSKNNDVNVVSAYTDSIRFITPTDSTIPDAPTGLELAASFFNVLFKYIDSTGNDIAKYEYELYKQDQIETVDAQYQVISGETPHRTGYVQTNVFLVSVDDNSTTTSTSSTTNPVKYYGRVRAIDTAENIGGWTSIVASGDTPLIDEEFIGSLTAAKITAGEIGAHTIILSGGTGPGNYSMIQSSTYSPNDATPSGWYIRGDGHLNFGGPQGITYNGSSVVIGSGVNVQAELNANSITVGSGPYLRIDDDLQAGTKAGMELGDPTYNYWYTDGQFSLGNSSNYVRWNGTNLSVAGSIDILSGTVGGTPVSIIEQSAIDFNLRNNRNSTTPTAPTINSDGTAIDHTINTDGSVDISFEWNYTSSSTQNAANNIDGFYVYVYSSDSSGSYTFGTTPALESSYPVDSDRRAIVLSGVAANKYYTFGIKAFRVVDRDVNSEEILYSSIVKSTRSEENPYRPTANVAFAGNVTGTIDGTAVATLVSYATAGNTVATNYNSNNDRNSTTPTSPVVSSNGSAIDHVLNTDGSADISFEWTYTVSDTYNAANNIDGFIIYVRSSTSSSSYTFGTTPADETTYYVTREKRALILPAVAADRYYNFGVRAYRMVDTDINSAGIIYSSIIQSTGSGENPYRPTANVAFAGDITGTVNSVAVTTITTTVSNFNSNNDRKSTTPATPTSVAFSTAVSNTNASIDLPLTWTFTGSGDAYDIDGFVVFLRTTTSTNATNITTSDLNTNIQQVFLTAEKRSHTFSGISPSAFYRAAVRAYRVVDTDINSAGIIYGALANTTERTSAIATIGGSSGIKIGDGTIYIGVGNHDNTDTGFYVDSTGKFSLKNKFVWNGTSLTIAGDVTIGSTSGSTIASGAASGATALQPGQAASDVNSNSTTISGGKIRTGTIESTGYSYSSGNFSTSGTQINLDNGLIRSKNFAIDSSGNAYFSGTITASSGTIGGWSIGAVSGFTGSIYVQNGSDLSLMSPTGVAWFSAGVVTTQVNGFTSGVTTNGGALNSMFIRNIQYGGTKPGTPAIGDIYLS